MCLDLTHAEWRHAVRLLTDRLDAMPKTIRHGLAWRMASWHLDCLRLAVAGGDYIAAGQYLAEVTARIGMLTGPDAPGQQSQKTHGLH